MGRRSKHKRPKVRVTKKFIESKVKPRIQKRDRRIFRFLFKNRIATSEQIAKVFWKGSNQAQNLANRRLRILYDLHCIDRFFPMVQEGSSKQHVVLDRAGAKILGLDNFNKQNKLPGNHRHTVLQVEFRIRAKQHGWGWGVLEEDLGPIRADIFYEDLKAAVEIDRGTETHQTLKRKAEKYNKVPGLNWVIFVTNGPENRGDKFIEKLNSPARKARVQFKDLDDLFNALNP